MFLILFSICLCAHPSLICTQEPGFCVKEDGRDQNSGVKKLNSLDGNTSKRQEGCLKLCLATPGVTGCEVIWDQGNRGCYAHTQSVSRGNGRARHMCWICRPKPTPACIKEAGFCVKQDGRDQNSGVIKLNDLDGNTVKRQEDCFKLCLTKPGVTGCEVIWHQGNRGCYAHTQPVSRGNNVDRHMCWICDKKPTLTCSKEAGFCVKQDGRDQNSGVVKLNSVDGKTLKSQEECLKLCLATDGVTGCEVIWDQGNRGCYAHTQSVARGNGVARHMCWICGDVPTPTKPTPNPTVSPTSEPTPKPTRPPTLDPTTIPTERPTHRPTSMPTNAPTETPTSAPTPLPTRLPSPNPTVLPTSEPTPKPTRPPTNDPTTIPTERLTRFKSTVSMFCYKFLYFK